MSVWLVESPYRWINKALSTLRHRTHAIRLTHRHVGWKTAKPFPHVTPRLPRYNWIRPHQFNDGLAPAKKEENLKPCPA
ncbi:hypothetical protein F3I76_00020 [Pseudomonas sp. MT4]|nr:hypothetical protein [Pseudomonas sp. MT4]